MILYLIVSIWPAICYGFYNRCSFFKNKSASIISERIWIVLSMLPMFVLLAFRNKGMGPDTGTYWEAYKFASNNSFNVVFRTQKMEPGFLFVEFILSKIFPSPYFFQILYVSFYFLSIYYFVSRNGNHKFLTIFLLCTLGLFKFFFTGIRQCISMCICLLSFECVKKKQPFKFFSIVLVAILFHKSAILFSAVYFVYWLKHNLKNLLVVITICLSLFVGVLFFFPYLSSLLGYGEYQLEFTGNGFARFTFLFLLFICFVLNKENRNFKNNYERGLFNVSLIFMFMWFLRLTTRTAERVSLYYLPFFSIFISSKISVIFGSRTKESNIMFVIICSLLLFLFLHSLKTDNLVPYKSFIIW